jgi:hypothetical protein
MTEDITILYTLIYFLYIGGRLERNLLIIKESRTPRGDLLFAIILYSFIYGFMWWWGYIVATLWTKLFEAL